MRKYAYFKVIITRINVNMHRDMECVRVGWRVGM